MVRIKVIWFSVKYQYFFCFQNVTSPPNAINVPFISSHIKVVSRTVFTNMTVLLSMWAGFFFFFFYLKLNSILFLKEIVLVLRNCCIRMSEIELVFRQAEFWCSGSLYSMLLFKKLYLIQIFNNIF